ncbi:MAG TPA: 2-phospho-L-lactate transferase CofD family protein, partial [Actinotalea sp.]|nr:2-phospho-L-lactate transferase CofD family protein [Actinotalea sp.]
MKVVLLAGGVGGARFTRGLRDLGIGERRDLDLTVVVNTGDDLWLDALRVCPDLDTVMYTLGGVIGERGWGRADDTTRVTAELHAYGLGWDWFTLGDLDLGTHVARTELLRGGMTLSEVTARFAERWQPGVTVLPMSDDEVETWVEVLRDGARRFVQRGVAGSRPAPGVREALADADLVLLPPSNPVVSVGTILGVPGVRDAVRTASAPVVGVSPIIGGAPVR